MLGEFLGRLVKVWNIIGQQKIAGISAIRENHP